MPPEFKPSSASLTSAEKTKAVLRYIRKAVDLIEAYIEQEDAALPSWVHGKIQDAGRLLGLVVSAVEHLKSRPNSRRNQ